MLNNSNCDSACSTTKDCYFDYLDCKSTIYVQNNTSLGSGTLASPYNDLSYAISRASSGFTYIYLIGTSFYLNQLTTPLNKNDPFAIPANTQEIIIRPLYCSDSQTTGCYSGGTKPVITLTDKQVVLSVSYNVTFINVTFSHHYTFTSSSNCSDCTYCRTTINNQNGDTYSDQSQLLLPNTYLNSDVCTNYSNYELFQVKMLGKLTLQVFFT